MKFPFIAIAYVPTNEGRRGIREEPVYNDLQFDVFKMKHIIGNRRLDTRRLTKKEIITTMITSASSIAEKEAYAKSVLDYFASNSKFPEYHAFDLAELINGMDAEDIEQARIVKQLCQTMLFQCGFASGEGTNGDNIKLTDSGRAMARYGFFTLYVQERHSPQPMSITQTFNAGGDISGSGNTQSEVRDLKILPKSQSETKTTTAIAQKSGWWTKLGEFFGSIFKKMFISMVIAYLIHLMVHSF